MKEKTLPFRTYAQILIFSALVAAGAMILWPIQQAVYGGAVSIRDDLIQQFENLIGRKVIYSSISPSLLGSFDVRNVNILGFDDRPVLTMSRFRVAYSLLDLLRGRTQAIRSVQIDTPNIDFNTVQDNDLLNLFKGGDGRDGGRTVNDIAAMLPEKLLIRIRNGRCMIRSGVELFEMDTLNFDAEVADNRMIIDGRWNINFSAGALIGAPVYLNLAMHAGGYCRTDMKEGEIVFSVPAVTGDAVSSVPVSFDLILAEDSINVFKVPDRMPYDFSAAYGINDGDIDVKFTCRNFKLSEFVDFSGGLAPAGQLLDISSFGTASFERKKDGSMDYEVDLSSSNARIGNQPMRASFEIQAKGDEKSVSVSALHVSMPRAENAAADGVYFAGDIFYAGDIHFKPFSPDGILSLDNFTLSSAESINANITVSTQDSRIRFFCDAMRLGKVDLAAFTALILPSETGMGFTVSSRRGTNGRLSGNARPGSFSLRGEYNSGLRDVAASLIVDSFSVADIVGITGPFVKDSPFTASLGGIFGATLVTTEISLKTDFTDFSYNAPNFVFAGGKTKSLTGSVSGTEKGLEIKNGKMVWDGEVLLLSLGAEFSGPENIGFSMNAGYRNLGYQIEGAILDGKSVNVNGSFGLNVKLEPTGRGSGYSGYVRAERFPVPFLGNPAFVTIGAQVRYDTAASWSMELEQLEAEGVNSPAGPAALRVCGTAGQAGANFPVVNFRDSQGPLSGNAELSWSENFSQLSLKAVLGENRETYRMEGSLSGENLAAQITGSSMKLERFLKTNAAVAADGEIQLSRNGTDSFHAELSLSLLTGKIREQEFRVTAHAVLDNENLLIDGIKFNYAGLEASAPNFTFNGADGKAETSAEIRGNFGGRQIECDLSMNAGFAPIRSWQGIGEALAEVSGRARVDTFRFGSGEPSQPFDINFSRSDGAVSVSGGPRNMLRFQSDTDGNFYAKVSSPFPVRGTVAGSIKDKTINARCGDLYVDLADLFNIIPEGRGIFMTGGYVNASVDIQGSVADPEFYGTSRWNSMRIQVPAYVTQDIRPVPFNAVIDGNEIRFGPVSTTVGSGAGTIGGWFRFDRWIPNIFSLDIAVPRGTPIPFAVAVDKFLARGDTSGALNISMENQQLDVSGELYANNAELGVIVEDIFRLDVNRPPVNAAAPQKAVPVVVGLTVTTGPVVEFLYPDSRYPILRANPDMGTKIHITADSLAEQFSVTSDVRIRGGEIFYFERSFYIRSGTLTFRENERKFEPRLTARAEARDRTDEGPVTISMIVDNAPLLSFTARFESNPPLSQMEILSLLGQSITGTQVDESTGEIQRAFLSSTADLLAQFVVVRQTERLIRNFIGLDMFSVRTQFLQNMAFTAAGLMPTPVDRNPGVSNYLDNTTVFGGKYIGQDMFIQGMLSMRYDANKTSFGGLTVEPNFGVELQNPLFSIRWDFVPAHPENWYVNDNSITLTWSRSF